METALYLAAQVRELDKRSMQKEGISGYQLMCRAGHVLLAEIISQYPATQQIAILCGAGNNGGDGYVLARLANEQGIGVQLLALRDPEQLNGSARQAADAWIAEGGQVVLEASRLPQADVYVDAMLGTGFSGEPSDEYAFWINALNRQHQPVIAVDIASGLNADTGVVPDLAVFADITITFIARKPGLYMADGPEYSGRIIYSDLSVDASVFDELSPEAELLTSDDTGGLMFPRPLNSHKGLFGHLLCVGGYRGMSGAIRLCSEAALRSGAGLVSVWTHTDSVSSVSIGRPELMVQGEQWQLPKKCNALALGPGLGQQAWAREMLYSLPLERMPAVIDADALALLDEMQLSEDAVITPHPGEAAALLACSVADIQSNRLQAAQQLAERYACVVVLKGCGTVITQKGQLPRVYSYCDPAMSSGGFGDVLTGIIAALLAQGLEAFDAATLGVITHGEAAARANPDGVELGLLASDLFAYIPALLGADYAQN